MYEHVQAGNLELPFQPLPVKHFFQIPYTVIHTIFFQTIPYAMSHELLKITTSFLF